MLTLNLHTCTSVKRPLTTKEKDVILRLSRHNKQQSDCSPQHHKGDLGEEEELSPQLLVRGMGINVADSVGR